LLAFNAGTLVVLSGITIGFVILIGTLIWHHGKRRQRLSGSLNDKVRAGLEFDDSADSHETVGGLSRDLKRDWWDSPEF
jgi:hypothetical protein